MTEQFTYYVKPPTQPRDYTSEEISTIRSMCAEGRKWDEIAAAIGVSKHALVEFARGKLHCSPKEMQKKIMAERAQEKLQGRGQEPLPAGHRLTWGVICPGYAWMGK